MSAVTLAWAGQVAIGCGLALAVIYGFVGWRLFQAYWRGRSR